MTRVAIAVAFATLALCAGAAAASPPNAADLESQLVCPVCETTLDQSNAPVAERMKTYIRRRIAQGASEAEIKNELVAEFGKGVLARPPEGGFGLLAWLLPLAAVVVGAVAAFVLVRSWTSSRPPVDAATEPLDPALERRLDDELARFDA